MVLTVISIRLRLGASVLARGMEIAMILRADNEVKCGKKRTWYSSCFFTTLFNEDRLVFSHMVQFHLFKGRSMSQKLYIGNLPYRTTEIDIRSFFSKFEPILSVVLISDRETGRSRGFGFIELEDAIVDNAVSELSDTIFGGRNLRISKARDKGEGLQQAQGVPQLARA